MPQFDLEKRMSLALVAIGEKPAASVKFMDSDKKRLIDRYLEITDYEHISFETGMHHKYYIATDISRFQMLEKVEKDSPYHTVKSEGIFLGYPRSAVDFFASNRREASKKFKAKVASMIENDLMLEENLHYLDLICYVPEASAEAILEAIEHGKLREQAFNSYDEENDSCMGERILDEVFSRSTPFTLR